MADHNYTPRSPLPVRWNTGSTYYHDVCGYCHSWRRPRVGDPDYKPASDFLRTRPNLFCMGRDEPEKSLHQAFV